jgi:hypothetical protein
MDTSSRFGLIVSFSASVIIVTGAAVLHSTVLPDQPGLAFFLSLASGTVATIILARSGRGPF